MRTGKSGKGNKRKLSQPNGGCFDSIYRGSNSHFLSFIQSEHSQPPGDGLSRRGQPEADTQAARGEHPVLRVHPQHGRVLDHQHQVPRLPQHRHRLPGPGRIRGRYLDTENIFYRIYLLRILRKQVFFAKCKSNLYPRHCKLFNGKSLPSICMDY